MTLDDAIPEITPNYETLKSEYPDIKALEQKIKGRCTSIESPIDLESLIDDGEIFRAALDKLEVKEFMDKLNKS